MHITEITPRCVSREPIFEDGPVVCYATVVVVVVVVVGGVAAVVHVLGGVDPEPDEVAVQHVQPPGFVQDADGHGAIT